MLELVRLAAMSISPLPPTVHTPREQSTRSKYVTVGQLKYVAGDSAPFRWFNAGDFGNTNLDNSGRYADLPVKPFMAWIDPRLAATSSDGMDSCGGLYVDLWPRYLEYSKPIFGANELNPLFDGNDTTIIKSPSATECSTCGDIYVTFRRSLDPSLTWFRSVLDQRDSCRGNCRQTARHPKP